MILQFKFSCHKNYLDTIKRTIIFCTKTSKIPSSFWQSKSGDVFLEINGTQKALESFSQKLSNTLPLSLCKLEINAQIINKISKKKSFRLNAKKQQGFCQTCLKQALKSYDPFKPCEICNKTQKNSFSKKGQKKEFFINLAKQIKNAQSVKIGTSTLSAFTPTTSQGDTLIFANTNALNKYIRLNQAELNALASIEKPVINLPVNLEFKKTYEFFEQNFVNVCLAKDLSVYLVLQELFNMGVDFCAIKTPKPLFAISLEDRQIMPIKRLKTHKLTNGDCLIDLSKLGKISVKENDQLTTLLNFEFNFSSLNSFLNLLKDLDENAQKLVINYQKTFKPSNLADLNIAPSKMGLLELLGLIGLILEIYKPKTNSPTSKDLQISAQTIIKNADNFVGTKGMGLEYRFVKTPNGLFLDPRILLRSAMSFRLASSDINTLCFGLLESLSDFLLKTMSLNPAIKRCILKGQIFNSRAFLSKTMLKLGKNYKIVLAE